MLAVCGGGGSEVAVLLVVALAVAAWALVAVLVIRAAPERERKALVALTLVSGLAGPAILFGLLDGFSGDNDRSPEIVITLLLPALIGAGVAVGMRMAGTARAFLLALWGAVFVPGAYTVLVISFLTIEGCAS